MLSGVVLQIRKYQSRRRTVASAHSRHCSCTKCSRGRNPNRTIDPARVSLKPGLCSEVDEEEGKKQGILKYDDDDGNDEELEGVWLRWRRRRKPKFLDMNRRNVQRARWDCF